MQIYVDHEKLHSNSSDSLVLDLFHRMPRDFGLIDKEIVQITMKTDLN